MSTNEHRYRLLHNLERGHFSEGYSEGDRLVQGYSDSFREPGFDLLACAEGIFSVHNRDDRPDGQTAPSLSVGDVIVFDGSEAAFAVADFGFKLVPVPTNVESEKTWKECIK